MPLRVLLVTLLFTLLSFAVSLLLGIMGIVIGSRVRGTSPNLALAYRNIALPAALAVGAMVFVFCVVLEVRHYRQTKALVEMERVSRDR